MALGLRPNWLGVVVGAVRGPVTHAVSDVPVVMVHAPDWREGLSGSIRAGLRAVPKGSRHVLIVMSDQWALDPRGLMRLVRYRDSGVTATGYADGPGAPALFAQRSLPALTQLRGDRGARAVLKTLAPRVQAIRGSGFDLDTPAALAELRRLAQGHRKL
jgi:molybdenum cofactor cytidylyltransferase